jgi:hypothetical protein
LLQRFESILNLSESDELKTLDEIERVSGETLESWASRREEQLAKKLREENEKAHFAGQKRCTSTPPSEQSK